ncbi:MAG: hypothetical protein ACF8PN_04975 [Phycisphaerales bacterium]
MAALELPRLSLGWVLWPWIERRLALELTRDQVLRLFDLYAVDEDGRRLVRRAGLRRPKGAGKSPEGGYLALAELAGPVVFAGLDTDGRPMGHPHPDPLVQVAAVSEDQTDNVYRWLYDQLIEHQDLVADLHLDIGLTRINKLGGRRGVLEPVTASAPSREGARLTFGVLDQTEAWDRSNGGRKLADVMRRNAGKVGGWTYELQNAPEPGDGTVADATAQAGEKQARGVLYDGGYEAGEAVNLADRVELRTALELCYGDSAADAGGWVDLDRLVDEVQDPDTDPADARRFYLNTVTTSSERAFDAAGIGRLEVGDPPEPGELVVAGFDGSRFDDSTALVGCGVDTGRLWLAGLWERPSDRHGEWEVPKADVDLALGELFDRWTVWRVNADPAYWETELNEWAERFGPGAGKYRRDGPRVVHWYTNRWRQVGTANKALATAIRTGAASWDGSADFGRHLRNAVRSPVGALDEDGRRLWKLAKPSPSRKIDAAMAAVLAWQARNDYRATYARRTKRPAGETPRVAGFR